MAFELANGETVNFDLFSAAVLWDGEVRQVVVCAADGGPLVGIAMLRGCHLGVDVEDGGRVEIFQLAGN